MAFLMIVVISEKQTVLQFGVMDGIESVTLLFYG